MKKQLLQNFDKKQKFSIILTAVVIVLILIYLIALAIYRSDKVEVTVKYAPYSATITLNDTKIPNNTKTYLKPGTYQLKVAYDHFTTYSNQITISSDAHYIVGILAAADDEGKSYQTSHKTEFVDAQGIAGVALNEEGLKIKKKYPILNYLPFNNALYSISYAYADSVPIITVKTEAKYLDIAVAKMKTFDNVDLTSYQINFTPKNPYLSPTTSSESDPVKFIKAIYQLDNNHIVSDGKTIDNYYVTSIYINDYNEDMKYDHYRLVLVKDNNSWKVVATPQPLLTTKNTPNVSTDILKAANNL